MNPANRKMPQEAEWDMNCAVDSVIEAADYAILKSNEALLIISAEEEVLRGVALRNEQGLHYDGDSSIKKSYAQQKLEEGSWEVSQEWPKVEEHLK